MHLLLLFPLALLLTACQNPFSSCKTGSDHPYTLYRNSPIGADMRLHVATFDSTEGDDDNAYNNENCKSVAKHFQETVTYNATFWCEKGQFKE